MSVRRGPLVLAGVPAIPPRGAVSPATVQPGVLGSVVPAAGDALSRRAVRVPYERACPGRNANAWTARRDLSDHTGGQLAGRHDTRAQFGYLGAQLPQVETHGPPDIVLPPHSVRPFPLDGRAHIVDFARSLHIHRSPRNESTRHPLPGVGPIVPLLSGRQVRHARSFTAARRGLFRVRAMSPWQAR